jgi:hypothetical protein
MRILRDEYLDYITCRRVEKPLFTSLFGLLVGVDDEWRAQGATEDEVSLKAFDFDVIPRPRIPVATGRIRGLPEEIVEDNEDFYIKRDSLGRRIKLFKKSATIPLPLDYPVTDMDSWRKMKHMYEYDAGRLPDGWEDKVKAWRDEGLTIMAGIPGGFDEPRQLMGEENACLGFLMQPELMHDILDTIGSTAERVLDQVSSKVQVDGLSVHEDLAGKTGSLVGPDQIREFIKPYYRRCWDLLESRGATFFDQDSDGNLHGVMDAFLDAGLTMMHPMEPAAGMDIVQVREQYGERLAMYGGIDKHVLREDQDAIRKELEYKMQPKMRNGGVIFGLDHRIPNGTPLEHFRYYVKTAREVLGREPVPGL